MEKEQTTIRLPAEMKEQLVREAKEGGMSFNELVMILLHRYRSRREASQTRRHV